MRVLPFGWLWRGQEFEKRKLVSKLGRLPPEIDAEEARRQVEGILRDCRQLRLAGERGQRELAVLLRRHLRRGDFGEARRALREVLPDARPRWGRVVAVVALTVGAASLGGAIGWSLRAAWIGLLALEALNVSLLYLFTTEVVPRWGYLMEEAEWIEARIAAGDGESALAAYREVRRTSEESGEESARVMQAFLLCSLARSALELPLEELAGDARELAELPGSNEHWWTVRALDALADRLDAFDQEEAAALRELRDRIRPAAEELAERLEGARRYVEDALRRR